ncbi:DUF2771 family protein [Gordonia sp. VNQ95]|uniref:DUF2771 family protein n=1 Tax=Gordonia sp. VNQ95 TaxID=3156619 RepID=UPI0032B53D8B
MLNSGDKKAIAIILAVVVVFVAVVGTTVGILAATGTSHKDAAYLQLAVGDELHTVEPVKWCDVYLKECDPPLLSPQRETPHIPIPAGQTILLSVSDEIAKGPWNLTTLYWTPEGLAENESPFASGTTFTVPLRTEPQHILLGITITAASVVASDDGTTSFARGVLTVDTSPANVPQIR